MTDKQTTAAGAALDRWIDAHFDEEVAFLRDIVRVPSDTPPGDNVPAAERAATLLEGIGFAVERHAPPMQAVKDAGLTSVVNLVVRHQLGEGRRIPTAAKWSTAACTVVASQSPSPTSRPTLSRCAR
jgi:succinyl-diaminopimelate desuccinylase